jgi:hypothetical protein
MLPFRLFLIGAADIATLDRVVTEVRILLLYYFVDFLSIVESGRYATEVRLAEDIV